MREPALQPLDEGDFYATLSGTPGVSIVFFTKPACGSCRVWEALLMQLRQQRPDLNIFRVDAEQNTALAREYDLFHLPALFVFRDGEFHAGLQSEARLAPLIAELERVLDNAATEAP